MRFQTLVLLATVLALGAASGRQTREEKVRADKARVEAAGFWHYNDVSKGFQEAKRSGKPILVVLRCLPCEECVKLDDDLINNDPRIKPLLDRFVRVRVISANGLDLSQFQFDTDQSFAVFMLNADGTVYGRYGTRSHRTEWADDVSVEGLSKALSGALALHAKYPANKADLAAKRGPLPEFTVPENLPLLRGKYGSKLDYAGNVVKSCIHCHQVGDAQRQHVRDTMAFIPEQTLFPYPHPKTVGLALDPKERATILKVDKLSPAGLAGFRPGDVVDKMGGQPLLSMADVQWVLHQVSPEGGTVRAEVVRAGLRETLTLDLRTGWRQMDDLSWRASSWELRRMVTGGMQLAPSGAEERADAGLKDGGMALRVEHVGEYSPHDIAKKAGFRKGDLVVSFDGRKYLSRETDVLAYGLMRKSAGDSVDVVVVRNRNRVSLPLVMSR